MLPAATIRTLSPIPDSPSARAISCLHSAAAGETEGLGIGGRAATLARTGAELTGGLAPSVVLDAAGVTATGGVVAATAGGVAAAGGVTGSAGAAGAGGRETAAGAAAGAAISEVGSAGAVATGGGWVRSHSSRSGGQTL